MRLMFNIFTAISLLFLVLILIFWPRSYFRFEGVMHYSEGSMTAVKAGYGGKSVDEQVTGRSSGWVSFPGQLTYVSITNPARTNDWESWSASVDIEEGNATWSMSLAAQAASRRGIGMGSAESLGELRDHTLGYLWQVPYWYFTAPYWLLTVLFAILPYRWVREYRRVAMLRRKGLCVRCEHSVEGISGNCPKCGEPIAAPEGQIEKHES
jgi:hypothetical protein